MKIGLFFGSFNPIHIGHLIIADYFAENTDVQQVWFIISPQNPFKEKKSLLDEKKRLYMVNIAVEENPKFLSSNVEFHLPQPSYTIDTLTYLQEKYPQHTFVLLMGSDNLQNFHKWKNFEIILKNFSLYVYKRRGNEGIPENLIGNISLFDVPLLDISSTFIRTMIHEKKSVRYLLPSPVWIYLSEMRLYQ